MNTTTATQQLLHDPDNTASRPMALVTGASGGIGRAICHKLSQTGIKVGIHYSTSDLSAKKLSEELIGSFLIKADLSSIEDLDRIYDQLKEMGGLDILVNNAGMTIDSSILRGKLEDFDRVVSVNMRSTWYLTKRLARLMMKKSQGRIINISSVIGSTGNVGQSIYGMTKAAINNLTKSCAQEFAPYNILVNAIAPGFIQTPMTEGLVEEVKNKIIEKIPLGRMGRPEDIAEIVEFLATKGTYCTGNIFHVNGGLYGAH